MMENSTIENRNINVANAGSEGQQPFVNGISMKTPDETVGNVQENPMYSNHYPNSELHIGSSPFPVPSDNVQKSSPPADMESPRHSFASSPGSISSASGQSMTHVSKPSASKLDNLKQWGISTYKCHRQSLFEKLGKSTKTVDTDLEAEIAQLRETQKKYANILHLTETLANHFESVVNTQHDLAEAFSELVHKSKNLEKEFNYNAETQRNLSKNGQSLLAALHHFMSGLNTLCSKTMEDTLVTIKKYEAARLEYDAYRNDLEELSHGVSSNTASSKIEEARRNFISQKEKYEQLHDDIVVKMKFLDENKVKVMQKELYLFNNAVSAYFSGNHSLLEQTLKQFSVKPSGSREKVQPWNDL